jgi:hypothetical protein
MATMVKRSGNGPEAMQAFAAALSRHLDRGTRAKVEFDGEPWAIKEFAGAVGVSDRTVRAWLKGEYAPNDLRSIVRELFGDNEKCRADRNELRTLYRLSKGSGLNSVVEPTTTKSSTGQSTGSVLENYEVMVEREFRNSDALLVISVGQTNVATNDDSALVQFRNIITRLWEIDQSGDRRRVLIWILDLGRQVFGDPDSHRRYVNVQTLLARFKALKLFKETDTSARWQWLQSRAVILLRDTLTVQPGVPKLSGFDPNEVLFTAVPPRWAESPEFLALYERRMLQTSYNVFVAPSETAEVSREFSVPAGRHFEFQYFAVARVEPEAEPTVQALNLKRPGRDYVRALGTVYGAALQMLGFGADSDTLWVDGVPIDSAIALEELRHHGFLLLDLESFVKQY